MVGDISVNLLRVRASAHSVERSVEQVRRRSDPFALAAVQLSGSSVLTTPTGTVTLTPGDQIVHLWESPSRWSFPGSFSLFVVRFPTVLIRFALADPSVPLGVLLPTGRGTGALVHAYVRTLAADMDLLSRRGGARIARGLVELFGTGLLAAAPGGERGGDVFARATAMIDERIADHDLGVTVLAQALYVSRRRLQAAFAEQGSTVTGWIRARRLQGARADLVDIDLRDRTIAEIARQWGFPDAAHFTHVFRRAYGLSPRDHRRPTS